MRHDCFYYWEELRQIIKGITSYEEDIRRLTADARRAVRTEAAWDASWNAAAKGTEDWQEMHAVASALLWLEEKGLYGGGNRDPGAGTKRLRFFRHLGKGRRHASDGQAWTEAIGRACRRYGFLQWDLVGGALGVRFEPYQDKKEVLREYVLPLRELLLVDGDESADSIEAWLGATKHAVRDLGKPLPYEVGEQTKKLLIAAVAEYTAAKEALARARELEVAKPQEAEAQDSCNS
jgi:hypothetical protein